MSFYKATPIMSHDVDLGQRYLIEWPGGSMERTFTDEAHMKRWLQCMNDSAACDKQASASYHCD